MTVRALAYAKVNLTLEVVGRRDDGFHEIVSIVQTISLHDVVECSEAPSIRVQTVPNVVEPAENLVTRAAELLASLAGPRVGADIRVRKRIPVAAGLGGGSSDAAATLRALDHLWQVGLDPAGFRALAGQIGSDVFLFLVGGTALMSGRGDQVRPLTPPPPMWLALACPPCPISDKTRTLYAALRPEDWSNGDQSRDLARRLEIEGRESTDPMPLQGADLLNSFDRAATFAYPNFGYLRERLADAAGAPLHLTGAGPSLFAPFRTRREASDAARRMAKIGVPCHVASPVAGINQGPAAARGARWWRGEGG